jgi:hypothetical protein
MGEFVGHVELSKDEIDQLMQDLPDIIRQICNDCQENPERKEK